jgi:hypothetical protein
LGGAFLCAEKWENGFMKKIISIFCLCGLLATGYSVGMEKQVKKTTTCEGLSTLHKSPGSDNLPGMEQDEIFQHVSKMGPNEEKTPVQNFCDYECGDLKLIDLEGPLPQAEV